MCLADKATINFNLVAKNQHVLDFKLSIFKDSYDDLLLYDYKEKQLGVPIFTPSFNTAPLPIKQRVSMIAA